MTKEFDNAMENCKKACGVNPPRIRTKHCNSCGSNWAFSYRTPVCPFCKSKDIEKRKRD